MEFFLIKALAFLRPVLSIHTGISFATINLFELAAMIFSAMIMAAFGIRAAVKKELNLSSMDLLIVGFVTWCCAIYLIYLDSAHLSVLGKFILPPITYLVAKNAIPDREGYRRMLWLLIVGSSIPLLLSLGVIAAGGGIEEINYWTGVPRYEGVYYGAHDLAHNAAFLLMAVWLYVLLLSDGLPHGDRMSGGAKMLVAVLVVTAVALLYLASVRTSLLGLFVFGAVLLTLYYKQRSLVALAILVVGLGMMLSQDIQERFLPESAHAEKVFEFDIMRYGSNRPMIWNRQMSVFFSLAMDHQVAGIGIGSTLAEYSDRAYGGILDLDTHNDFLRVLVHTGIVGLLLFLTLQLLILQRILGLRGAAKWGFLALFAAVTVMNLVSNSYVNRFGLAQMLYLVLAYIELPQRRSTSRAQEGLRPGSVAAIR